jgi:hypothetical protein
MKMDWNNLFKIRIRNSDDSFQKHEVIKLLIVMKLLKKHNKRSFIRIYTEFNLEGLIPDVYFEDIKSKSVVCYEIQKDFSKKWLEEKTKQYNNYQVPFMNSVDFIPINLNECPDNIQEINNWLEKYII